MSPEAKTYRYANTTAVSALVKSELSMKANPIMHRPWNSRNMN